MISQEKQPIISLQQVSKKYGTVKAVDNLCLDLWPGESLALFGPSGCGKTTTLRLLAGLEYPDQGEIYLQGRCVSKPGKLLAPHRRGIGMVFQDLALWPHLTVAQHLDFVIPAGKPRKGRQFIRDTVISQVQLPRPTAYPGELSGGERQRLALARALASGAEILLLDEPFANLDTSLKKQLLAELKSLLTRFKVSMIYVTHQWREAASLVDRVAMMNEGQVTRIVQRGQGYTDRKLSEGAAGGNESTWIKPLETKRR